MAFTVEDGTGLEDANAYVEVAFVDSYFADRGIAAWTGSSTVKQQAIVRATDYIDTRYAGQFKGLRVDADQALQFGRTGIYDEFGDELDPMPKQLLKATAEYALRALSSTLMPDPTTDDSGQSIKRKTEKVGPIEETVEYHGTGVVSTLKPYPAADRLLTELLNGGFGQGRTIRA